MSTESTEICGAQVADKVISTCQLPKGHTGPHEYHKRKPLAEEKDAK